MANVNHKLDWFSQRHFSFTTSVVGCMLLVLISASSAQNVTIASTTSVTSTSAGSSTARSGSASNSPGVTQGQTSSATECILHISRNMTANVTEDLREVFIASATLIYFKLDFDDLTDIYDNSTDVIDPTTWVWAIEGRGELLLSYPFDFQQLSLGTLSKGVVTVDVPVGVPSDDCFQQAADAEKERILAKFIIGLVQLAESAKTDSDLYDDKTQMICLEKQLGPGEFDFYGAYGVPICTYYVLQGSTAYECWQGDADPFETEPEKVNKHGWLAAISVIGLILAVFSPLAARFFVREHPPFEKNGTGDFYLVLNSDLPVGLKYSLCFSFEDNSIIVTVRWFLYTVAFMIIPLIPFIVSYMIRGDAFSHRLDVVYEVLLDKVLVIFWFVLVNVVFLTIAMLFLSLYIYDETFVPKSLKVLPDDKKNFVVIELPSYLQVPDKKGEPFTVFMYTMLHRTQMAVNPDLWTWWFSAIWHYPYDRLGGRSPVCCQVFLSVVCFVVAFPFALVIFCFFLLLNSVPMLYLVTWTVNKSLDACNNCRDVFVAVFAMLLSFAVLFIFFAAFVYIAELIGYTFIGFVLNSDFAGPTVIAMITVVGYLVKAATDFYDKYCTLLKQVIEKGEEIDKDTPPGDPKIVGKDINSDVPAIPRRLFELVVAKYQPMYVEVASILLQLLIIIIVIVLGLQTILFIDGISDLPATVEFFATVIVALGVPLLMLILKSPAKEENDQGAKEHQLVADLKHYASSPPPGAFQSMILQ